MPFPKDWGTNQMQVKGPAPLASAPMLVLHSMVQGPAVHNVLGTVTHEDALVCPRPPGLEFPVR